MSNIYIQEPPTNGKVLLKTSVGDIDLELWSKEAPLACKNFVQLCLEGYYDNTIFHRLVKGFIVQGGDPTGTGMGGKSIYGQTFKDEIHSRLRFNRRGLVAMANAGKNDNGSQFFFTLSATPELQNKHTIFAKVGGKTIYNMIKLEEGEVDSDDRPTFPHKIINTEVLNNPFPDIVPRIKAALASEEKAPKKKTPKQVKDFKLLSFGEEAEDDEEEIEELNMKLQTKKKHNPDFIETEEIEETGDTSNRKKHNSSNDSDSEGSGDSSGTDQHKLNDGYHQNITARIRDKLNPSKKKPDKFHGDEKSKRLKWDKEDGNESSQDNIKVISQKPNQLIDEYVQEKSKYMNMKNALPKKGASREKQTLEMLMKFRQKINKLQQESSDGDKADDSEWLTHALKCDDNVVLAKDANRKDDDWFEITDPRNKLNKRRRENSKINVVKIKEDLR